MAAEAVSVSRWQATVAFIRDSYHEIRHKTTWPDYKQVQQASLYIIVFVLFFQRRIVAGLTSGAVKG